MGHYKLFIISIYNHMFIIIITRGTRRVGVDAARLDRRVDAPGPGRRLGRERPIPQRQAAAPVINDIQ